MIPSVRRTWAPRGQTPRLHYWQRHDRISAISGVSVSPKKRRLGLYFQLHHDNLHAAEVCGFLRELLRHLRGHVIVVWDNGNIHKGPLVRALCSDFRRLRLEALPPYAPELNPDEGVWNHAKATLANGRPDSQERLLTELVVALEEVRGSQRLLRGCVAGSALPPFLP